MNVQLGFKGENGQWIPLSQIQPRNQNDRRGRSRSRSRGNKNRSRSKSRSNNPFRKNGYQIGGPYVGWVPVGGPTGTNGNDNVNYPHNYDEKVLLGKPPTKFTLPSRARFTRVKYTDGKDGVHVMLQIDYTIGDGKTSGKQVRFKERNETSGLLGAFGIDSLSLNN